MASRPRPVTATVTKPRWMQIPDPDYVVPAQARSFESNGSTESLVSLLDKIPDSSYMSEDDKENDCANKKDNEDNHDITYSKEDPKIQLSKDDKKDNINNNNTRVISPSKSIESSLSAWEQWIVCKAKEDRKKIKEEKRKKKEEEALKKKEEEEKQMKLKKAEIVRQQWVEQKNKDELEQRKEEKLKRRNEKLEKQEIDQQIQEKAKEKFSLWSEIKKKEEKEKRLRIKEENQKIKEFEEKRKQIAEHTYKQWLRQAATRPKSAPNSFGYIGGRMTGYHDRSAYPQPSFYNPVPWHPPAPTVSQKEEKKSKKQKVKPYKWNPDKYF